MPSKHNAPTCFVRGLSYSLTDEALTLAFSAIAPVKRAFIVKDGATNASRGFGFVQFAFEDDAKICAEKLDGSELDGRKIRVEVASAAAGKAQADKRKAASSPATGTGTALAKAATARPRDATRGPTIVAAAVEAAAASSAPLEVAAGAAAAAAVVSKKRSRKEVITAADGDGEVRPPAPPTPAAAIEAAVPVTVDNAAAAPAKGRREKSSVAAEVSDAATVNAAPLPVTSKRRADASVISEVDAAVREAEPAEAPAAAAAVAAATAARAGSVSTGSGLTTQQHRHLLRRQRTLALFGLPPTFDGKRLWKRVRKIKGLAEPGEGVATAAAAGDKGGPKRQAPSAAALRFPVSLAGSERLAVALVFFSSQAARDRAAARLDGAVLAGHALGAIRGEDLLERGEAFTKARLIVRNLEFHVGAADLRAALTRACASRGATTAPPVAEEGKRSAAKATAAEGTTKAAAGAKGAAKTVAPTASSVATAAAKPATTTTTSRVPLQLLHIGVPPPTGGGGRAGQLEEVPPPTAEEAPNDDGGDAAEGATRTRRPAVNRGFAFLEFATRRAAADALAALNETKINRRLIAVDWAVSESSVAAPVGDASVVAEAVDAVTSTATEPGDDDVDSAAEGNDDDDDAPGDGSDAEAAAEDEDDDEEAEGEASPQYAAAPVTAGTTLFVRNLPFDADDAALYRVMAPYGPLRYARVVIDKDTGRCKGTAFVQYHTKEGADNALEASGARDNFSAPPTAASTPAAAIAPPVAKPDADPRAVRRAATAAAIAATLREGGIRMAGRVLFVLRAVEKDDATRIRGAWDAGEAGATQKFDRRHTYLAYEGNIRAGSAAAEAMPATDLAKRETAASEKRTKLKSPMFFVSPTRLSIRNLAKGVDDAALKALARRGAAAGLAAGLVDPTEGDPALMPPRGTPLPTRVVIQSAKIVREAGLDAAGGPRGRDGSGRARFEADGVTPRSRGYGFVDFADHITALAALRYLNNNPELSAEAAAGGAAARAKPESERPRLIVEFALENILEVRKHERRAAVAAERRAAALAAAPPAERAAKAAAAAAAAAAAKKKQDSKDKRAQAKAAAAATAAASAETSDAAPVGAVADSKATKRQRSDATDAGTAAADALLPAKRSRRRDTPSDDASPAISAPANDAADDAPATASSSVDADAAANSSGAGKARGKNKLTFRERRDRMRAQRRERRARAEAAVTAAGGELRPPTAAAAKATAASKPRVRFEEPLDDAQPRAKGRPASSASAPVQAKRGAEPSKRQPVTAPRRGGVAVPPPAATSDRTAREPRRQVVDPEIDRLLGASRGAGAAAGAERAPAASRKRRRDGSGEAAADAAAEAVHDRLVSQYKAKLFGSSGAASSGLSSWM